MPMSDRFFPTTILRGRSYTDGIGERGPWDTSRLVFQDAATVELLVARVGHQKAKVRKAA